MNKELLKEAARAMASEVGLINISRKSLCDRVDIPDGSFLHVAGCNFTDFIEELKGELFPNRLGAGPTTKSRANPELRKEAILTAAIELAKEDNYLRVTRDNVAAKAGVSMGLVSRYFGTMKQLRRDIIRTAIKREIPEIVAQGLANKDPHVKKAPEELKAAAAKLLTKF